MGFYMASATEVWLTQPVLQLLIGHERDVGGPGDGYKRELPLAPLIAQCPPRHKIIKSCLMGFLQHYFFILNPMNPLWSA